MLKKELNYLLGSNTLLAANYLESGISNPEAELGEPNYRKEFNQRLRGVLYEKYEEPSNSDSQLKEIAEKIVSSKKNRGITKVITYNYDDLLQREIKKANPDFEIETVFRGDVAQSNRFPIYHVHGFLPEDDSKYKEYEIKDQEIVFTEKSYFDLQQLKNKSERNRVQSKALRRNIVVMVGLSLNDPNLRRLLLETEKEAEVKTYVLLHSHSIKKSKYLKDLKTQVGNRFLERHHQILRQNLLKLGVDVIWYENHEDVVKILKQIF
nr:SIR2 family protein [Planococcus koreensis]